MPLQVAIGWLHNCRSVPLALGLWPAFSQPACSGDNLQVICDRPQLVARHHLLPKTTATYRYWIGSSSKIPSDKRSADTTRTVGIWHLLLSDIPYDFSAPARLLADQRFAVEPAISRFRSYRLPWNNIEEWPWRSRCQPMKSRPCAAGTTPL